MVKQHLKRISTPRTWDIKRKGLVYITRPKPGAHPMHRGMPLSVVLKDLLGLCKTTKEVKKTLYSKEVIVDGKRRKDHRYMVGLMDVISIKDIAKSYRVVLSEKGKLELKEVDDKALKYAKVKAKHTVKGGKIQLTLSDGNSLVYDNEVKIGDTAAIELATKKITKILPFGKGSEIYLVGGKHIGQIGKVEDIQGNKVFYKKGEEGYETLKRYAFVIEKGLIK